MTTKPIPNHAKKGGDSRDRSRPIAKAFVSFRIGPAQWLSNKRFSLLLDMLDAHPGLTDELALFTAFTHPPLPLDLIRSRAEVMANRIEAARARGYRGGINILATIGHHNENLPHSLQGGYTRMTALDGQSCSGSFCPNDEGFRQDYVKPLYAAIVQAGPDFIWIDDDVRLLGHMPIPSGCFCERCLALFAEECGIRYSRAALRRALTQKSMAAKLAIRCSWLDHNRRTIARLFKLIERTVHAIKPGLPLGFMTGERFFEGYDFDAWARILSGPRKAPVLWRPGGGFYSDGSLDGMTEKSHQIGRQVSLLPASVVSIQSEIENFPYQRLKKSSRTTALEAASHIAAGCTGAAFNVLSGEDEPLDEYEPLVAELGRTRPFLDLLARTLGRARPTGVYTGWTRNSFAVHGLDGKDWFSGGELSAPAEEIYQLGIPAAYSPDAASVTALCGNQPLALSRAEIRGILSRGVYLDAQALTRLNELGYGAQTGFEVERYVEKDGIEQFVPHPLNGEFAGRLRDCRQSFLWWLRPAAVLHPRGSAQVLSRLVDYTGKETAACCSGIYENGLGGRVCAAGYYPWTFLQNLSKSAQLKALFRWLSRDSLDAYVASFHRINLWTRRPRQGQLAVAILNASLDPAEKLELRLRTRKPSVSVFDMRGRERRIRTERIESAPYRRVVLDTTPAWTMRLVIA